MAGGNKTIYELYKITSPNLSDTDLLAIYNVQTNTTGRSNIRDVVEKGLSNSTTISQLNNFMGSAQRDISILSSSVDNLASTITNIANNQSSSTASADLGDLPTRVEGLENKVGSGNVGGNANNTIIGFIGSTAVGGSASNTITGFIGNTAVGGSASNTITGFIGNTALKTTKKTVTEAINELKAASTAQAGSVNALSSSYSTLSSSVGTLNSNSTALSSSYSTLSSSVGTLKSNYTTLNSNYTSLVSSTIGPLVTKVNTLEENLNGIYVKTLWTKDDLKPGSTETQGSCYYLNQTIYLRDDPTTYDYIDIYYEHFFDSRVAIQRFPGNLMEGKVIDSSLYQQNRSNEYSQLQNRYSIRFINLMDSQTHKSKYNAGMYELNLKPVGETTVNGSTAYAVQVMSAVKWRFFFNSNNISETETMRALSASSVEFKDVVQPNPSEPYGRIIKIKGIKFPSKDQ